MRKNMNNYNPIIMMVTSDPQYSWFPENDENPKSAEDPMTEDAKTAAQRRMKKLAENYIASLSKVLHEVEMDVRTRWKPSNQPYFGITINGDLVAFNNCAVYRDLSGFQDKFYKPYQKFFGADRIYVGLGNHDYINNDGKTPLNSGTLAMLDFLLDETRKRNVEQFDERDNKEESNLFKTVHEGSLAYYFRREGSAFIQLNEGPGFSAKISGELETLYDIKSSEAWLEKQLKALNEDDDIKSIFINLHEYSTNYNNKAILDKILQSESAGKVKAVFSGHYHKSYGKKNNIGKIPHFISGSASQGSFLSLVVNNQTGDYEVKVWRNHDILNKNTADLIGETYKL